MCVCRPEVRTPFCGRKGCEWPHSKTCECMQCAGGDHARGHYWKFQVRRVDGSSEAGKKHESCRYHVIDIEHDKFAKVALKAYADACEAEYPLLAADLRKIISE